SLYPGQAVQLDGELADALAGIPDGASKTDGVAVGQSVADAILTQRSHDGWDTFVTYSPQDGAGQWQPTAPMYEDALAPQWANLNALVMSSGDQFRPSGPPALESTTYADALNEVKTLGGGTGSARTPDQTQIARFWSDGGGTYTPPGHWNQIAEEEVFRH